MNREDQFVITISRQFGTGGHEIGAELARRLDVKLLDKQRDDFTNFYRNYMSKAEYDGTEHDQTSRDLFKAQAEAIRQIAAEESCVIVGRCGFHIFENHPNALKIFIHSSEDCRKRRIAEKYGLDLRDAAAMVVDNDYSRELYTKTFTGKDWTDARNYDISIDVRKFGINGAVDFLMKCIE